LSFQPVDLPVVGEDGVINKLYLVIDIGDHRIPLPDLGLDHGQLCEIGFLVFLYHALAALQLSDLLLDLFSFFFKIFPRLRN
jgi:hypothetical protein